MQDFETFQAALASNARTRDEEGEPTYMNSLMNSMSLVLDEFYKHLKVWEARTFCLLLIMSWRRRYMGADCRRVEHDGRRCLGIF
jgi:hypothetical protein